MKKKFIFLAILMLSIVVSMIITYLVDKNLYIEPEEYIENEVEIENIKTNPNEQSNNMFQIKYKWQIAIPKIDVIAPIGEGSDIIVLRNRVGHITGTGRLSR